MAPRRDHREIASDAWEWLSRAEAIYRNTEDGSIAEAQAIQAMSLASLAGMTAEANK